MTIHEVVITPSELMTVRAGGRVSALTDRGAEVRITDSRDKPKDKINAGGPGVVWLPITDFMNSELLAQGRTGFAPNYVDWVFGIRLDT